MSKSKSSSSQSSSVTDRSVSAGGDALVVTEGAVVDFLSDEALKDALDFAQKGNELTTDTLKEVYDATLSVIKDNTQSAFDGYRETQKDAFEQTGLALEAQRSEGLQGFKQFLYAGIAVTAIIGLAYVTRKG